MKWYLIGKEGPYYFWERNPDELESSTVYQTTRTEEPPVGEAGYYNLAALLRLKGVTKLTPSTGK